MNTIQKNEDVGTPEGISVIVTMRPSRVHGIAEEGSEKSSGGATDGVRKTYRTGSWFFASDFLDRVAEISTTECAGFQVRPVQVELRLELDEKAFRNVGLILDSFDNAYRAL